MPRSFVPVLKYCCPATAERKGSPRQRWRSAGVCLTVECLLCVCAGRWQCYQADLSCKDSESPAPKGDVPAMLTLSLADLSTRAKLQPFEYYLFTPGCQDKYLAQIDGHGNVSFSESMKYELVKRLEMVGHSSCREGAAATSDTTCGLRRTQHECACSVWDQVTKTVAQQQQLEKLKVSSARIASRLQQRRSSS